MVTRISFSYPEETKEKLQELAKADSRTLSSYIQKVLKEHIDAYELKPSESHEAKKPIKKRKRVK